VHVFGRGEASGLKLWRTTLNLVESIYEMYAKSKAGFHETLTTLDKTLFPEFAGRPMTWSSFTDECDQKEISRYSNVIRVVTVCKERTLDAMEAFREHVLDKTVPQEKADIVLVTCHSAKGIEWDNVQLCDDFIHLCAFSKVTGTAAAAVPPSSSQGSTGSERSAKNRRLADAWQFGFESWGDDVNLAYVACTRAKRMLSIPPCVHSVLLAFDNLHSWKYPELLEDGDEYVVVKPGASNGSSGNGGTVKTMAVTIPGCGKEVMTEEKAHGFYDSLVEPLRDELGMDDCKQLLMKTLINHHLPASEDAKVKRESLTSE
jgi:UvrD-like helicase C-terminal domain